MNVRNQFSSCIHNNIDLLSVSHKPDGFKKQRDTNDCKINYTTNRLGTLQGRRNRFFFKLSYLWQLLITVPVVFIE